MNYYDQPRRKLAGLVLLLILGAVVSLSYLQFRGALSDTTRLIVMSGRSGLVLDPGAKVTYNGVVVGRVTDIDVVESSGPPSARLTVEIGTGYMSVIPANVVVDLVASTIFGNKYVAFSAPPDPSAVRVAGGAVITASTLVNSVPARGRASRASSRASALSPAL